MTPLKHKAYQCVNPAHVAAGIAQYPTLFQQNLHLDQTYTDADLAPWVPGGVEGFIDFEAPGPIAEDPTTFTAARLEVAAYAIDELLLSSSGKPNSVGLYPVGGGGTNYNPNNCTFYPPGTALVQTMKSGGLFRHVWPAADAYIKNDDANFWHCYKDCVIRALNQARAGAGLLFLSPRYTDPALAPPNRGVVNYDVWNARIWTIRTHLDAGDIAAVCYWDKPDLTSKDQSGNVLDAAGQATVLAAADQHAQDFATVFPPTLG